jgi:hypothetical protein
MCAATVQQLMRTTANIHDNLKERIFLFAGTFEHRRILANLRIHLHMAEVAGSIPASLTLIQGSQET